MCPTDLDLVLFEDPPAPRRGKIGELWRKAKAFVSPAPTAMLVEIPKVARPRQCPRCGRSFYPYECTRR
jgi:hypothetical protein